MISTLFSLFKENLLKLMIIASLNKAEKISGIFVIFFKQTTKLQRHILENEDK